MRVLLVNTFDTGGAAHSCIRLHRGLLELGVESSLLLKIKTKDEPESFMFSQHVPPTLSKKLSAKARRILYEFRMAPHPSYDKEQAARDAFVKSLPKGSEHFSFPTSGLDITLDPLYQQADIVHLHWVEDFIDYPNFFTKNKKPVVWTLHDKGPFSGGLHYDEEILGPDENGDAVRRQFTVTEKQVISDNLKVKKAALNRIRNITMVSPSRWLMEESRKSGLFSLYPHYTIPYGIDHEIFKRTDKVIARELLNLPKDKRIILFAADFISNNRKGFAFLSRALEQLSYDNVLLCSVGAAKFHMDTEMRRMGRIHDERLMGVIYSAADVFVLPSVEDNLPNTMLESMLCGTPVIGFPVGGVIESIRDGFNGFLAEELSVEALAKAIDKFFENTELFDGALIRQDAIERFNLQRQARAYLELYKAIIN